jgi:peptide/nickel transport system ATP-binding protein
MYAGKIVEYAESGELFAHPLHPYTRGLFAAIPRLGADKRNQRLQTIAGTVPNPMHFPPGCRFHPRCPICNEDPKCKQEEPSLIEHRPGHFAACWHI